MPGQTRFEGAYTHMSPYDPPILPGHLHVSIQLDGSGCIFSEGGLQSIRLLFRSDVLTGEKIVILKRLDFDNWRPTVTKSCHESRETVRGINTLSFSQFTESDKEEVDEDGEGLI